VGIHANLDLLEFPEGANHQPGSDQQHQCQRQFAHHQSLAETRGRHGCGVPGRGGAESVVQVPCGELRDRRESESDSGGHAEKQSEGKDPPVDPDLGSARDVAGVAAGEQTHTDQCKPEADRRTTQRKQDALRQKLAHQNRQASPDRLADGDFPAARFRASQKQVVPVDD
jgi:hypothetical protein